MLKLEYDEKHRPLLIDDLTGEIVETKKPKGKKSHYKKYIGIETKWPSECKTQDHLIESLENIDPYIKNKPLINSKYLLACAVSHYTKRQIKLITFLAENITAWNYYIGSIKHLSECIESKHLAEVLKSLEGTILSVSYRNIPFRGDIVIRVNPLLSWRGDMSLLEIAKEHYLKSIVIKDDLEHLMTRDEHNPFLKGKDSILKAMKEVSLLAYNNNSECRIHPDKLFPSVK